MMTKSVVVTITLGEQNFAPGTALGPVHIEIGGGKLAAPLTQDVTAPSPIPDNGWQVVFPGIDEESATDPAYTYLVQQTDDKGVALGAAFTGTFSVLAPPSVSLMVPSSVTITVI
jgi:hypothetical protein